MKQKIRHLIDKRPRRKKTPEKSLEQAIQNIPRITNETVAEHREEVLSSARKYIYPLKHSAHRVVLTSISLIAVVLIVFFSYCTLALYKFHSTSGFMYGVTRVIPFPIVKAGPHYISYESYLFEVRHYIHYYQTQQKIDFSSESGKRQLESFRKQALQNVINDAYVKQLASEHHVSVSDRELNDEIELVRSQNRLGSNDQVFADVLKEFWGWSIDDFKRELKQQMLAQKVVSVLDTATHQRADSALKQLQTGTDFGQLAAAVSDDTTTKNNGGDYGVLIDRTNRNIPPQVIDQLFRLKEGQISDIINTGVTLEIVKVEQITGDKVKAAHMQFNLQPISAYTDVLRAKEKPHQFVHF